MHDFLYERKKLFFDTYIDYIYFVKKKTNQKNTSNCTTKGVLRVQSIVK